MEKTVSEVIHQLRSGTFYPFQHSPSMASQSVSTPTTHHASPQSVLTTCTCSSQARTAWARASYQSPGPTIYSANSVPSEDPFQLSTDTNMPLGEQNTDPHPQPSSILSLFSAIHWTMPDLLVSECYQSPDHKDDNNYLNRGESVMSGDLEFYICPHDNLLSRFTYVFPEVWAGISVLAICNMVGCICRSSHSKLTKV